MHTRPITTEDLQDLADIVSGRRRPRLGIMGEFSAGKSTLTNLLIGARALPVQVTATKLPPVWLSHGEEPPTRVDLDGMPHEVSLEDVGAIDLSKTQYIRVARPASFLMSCDIIDFPGISDPNMPSEVWERMVPVVDGVLWCTHATQAWRQSEVAVWEDLSTRLKKSSLLLVTRMDKLTTARDRDRVVSRVTGEAGSLFSEVLPISLTSALEARGDPEAWAQSGAAQLMASISTILGAASLTGSEAPAPVEVLEEPAPRPDPLPVTQEAPPDGRIRPRRVTLRRAARPTAR